MFKLTLFVALVHTSAFNYPRSKDKYHLPVLPFARKFNFVKDGMEVTSVPKHILEDKGTKIKEFLEIDSDEIYKARENHRRDQRDLLVKESNLPLLLKPMVEDFLQSRLKHPVDVVPMGEPVFRIQHKPPGHRDFTSFHTDYRSNDLSHFSTNDEGELPLMIFNIWISLNTEGIDSSILGFLRHPDGHLQKVGEAFHSGADRPDVEGLEIIYEPMMRFGDAYAFQLAGPKGLWHGAFDIDGISDLNFERRSVDVRFYVYKKNSLRM